MQPPPTTASQPAIRRPVKRTRAERYILISLVCFGLTVAVTRVYLELTGYPQIGNAVLHIAHALWGGLLLFLAVLVSLILANRWALTLSAVLSGVGVGLFIDEVGKFITQRNDYFFPPAAPIIYSAFLLMVLLFILVRQSRSPTPRRSMYAALQNLDEVLDNDLNPHERERLLVELNNGRTSREPQVALLAEALARYLQDNSLPLVPYRPNIWARSQSWLRSVGEKLGRRRHRVLVMGLLALGSVAAFLVAALLLWAWQAIFMADPNMPELNINIGDSSTTNPTWLAVRLGLQLLVSVLYLVALVQFWRGREQRGVNLAIFAALLAFTLVNLVNFYVSQFGALTAFFSNLASLFVLLTYRAWYLAPQPREGATDAVGA
jgi:hypothetical protein